MKTSAKLRQLEEENKDAMFVIVSDVWLDQVQVQEKLHIMFSGTFYFYFLSLLSCSEGLCSKAKCHAVVVECLCGPCYVGTWERGFIEL